MSDLYPGFSKTEEYLFVIVFLIQWILVLSGVGILLLLKDFWIGYYFIVLGLGTYLFKLVYKIGRLEFFSLRNRSKKNILEFIVLLLASVSTMFIAFAFWIPALICSLTGIILYLLNRKF